MTSEIDRAAFWRWCRRADHNARARAKAAGIRYSITAHYLDEILVDHKWACAVTKIALRTSRPKELISRVDPFGPSLDRIIPDLGYVRGNVRVVTNMANMAMNEWGLDNLLLMLRAMRENDALLCYDIRDAAARMVGKNKHRTRKRQMVPKVLVSI